MTHLWWYAARSGGFVAWGLLSASVIWGLMLSGKVRPGKVRPNWMLDLHRFLGGLACAFTAVHVLTIMADSYTSFGPTDVLVPFVSSWKPGAVAWGVVGLYLLAAVELTSLLKKHIPLRIWKRVHVLSLPLFAMATTHLLTAGTDAGNHLVTFVVGSVTTAVVGLTAWRVATLGRKSAPKRTGGPQDRQRLAPSAMINAR
ncbi:MAG: ferric reductase-like transmembrane domain-containing protein [Acidimicrobiales bacterium]